MARILRHLRGYGGMRPGVCSLGGRGDKGQVCGGLYRHSLAYHFPYDWLRGGRSGGIVGNTLTLTVMSTATRHRRGSRGGRSGQGEDEFGWSIGFLFLDISPDKATPGPDYKPWVIGKCRLEYFVFQKGDFAEWWNGSRS